MTTEGELSPRDVLELRWLARQRKPVWGGHIACGEALNDTRMIDWLFRGLIKIDGGRYVITEAGRQAIGGECPTCNGTGRVGAQERS